MYWTIYADVVLPEVKNHILLVVQILHNNARRHKTLAVRQKIKAMGMKEVLIHQILLHATNGSFRN